MTTSTTEALVSAALGVCTLPSTATQDDREDAAREFLDLYVGEPTGQDWNTTVGEAFRIIKRYRPMTARMIEGR